VVPAAASPGRYIRHFYFCLTLGGLQLHCNSIIPLGYFIKKLEKFDSAKYYIQIKVFKNPGQNMTKKFKDITLKQQIYLETIFDLSKSEGHAHVKAIAERLSNRMPSVSEAMHKLAEKKLINYDVRKNITLTDYGLKVARELDKRHSVLADFYAKILGCPAAKAQSIACKVEHVVDSEFCERLSGFASFIRSKEENGIELIQEFKLFYEDYQEKAKNASED
jgi:DtxR family Mn-dependent transcriptional regulator